MNKQNDPHSTDKTLTVGPTGTGAIRRVLNALRRREELMDHNSLDYTLDRIGQLEGRGVELERARNATVEIPPKSL